ncbi:hypothetical protein CWC21_16645 [Pseudoalteromonas phenolica]|nr:hypothetical protein CWC21_16645 [Pseudoalteromonas phenolica]
MMKTSSFCITQCNQCQQSHVLLLVQTINPYLAFNARIATQFNNQGSQLSRVCGLRIAYVRQVLNTQPLKAVIKLVSHVICLHGLIFRLRFGQSLASVIGGCEVLKNVCFWNALLTQQGGAHD